MARPRCLAGWRTWRCDAALRNPAAYDVAAEPHEHEALEQLATFSILARWIDAATLDRAS